MLHWNDFSRNIVSLQVGVASWPVDHLNAEASKFFSQFLSQEITSIPTKAGQDLSRLWQWNAGIGSESVSIQNWLDRKVSSIPGLG